MVYVPVDKMTSSRGRPYRGSTFCPTGDLTEDNEATMKRKAYIGLSSPTAYFYDGDKKHFQEPWQWNPILESPQGLITLFDELWFLSRPLCPVSLRKESYVKFLDEDSDFVPLIKALNSILEDQRLEGLAAHNPFIGNIIDLNSDYPSEQFKQYNKVIEHIYGRPPGEGAPIDNHSHTIDLCGFNVSGNSMRLELLAYDIAFLGNAGIENIELITNRFNSVAFKNKPTIIEKIQVSQGVTVKRIPVLQTPSGPIIYRIESIRESNFLVDFRNKILESNNPENFIDLVSNIEEEFQKYRNSVLLERQRGSRLGASIANNAFSFLVGAVVPGVGEVKSLMSDSTARNFNWTGFLAELEI